MTLPDIYVNTYGQLEEFFISIQQGQAPEQFTNQLLIDLGFKSSNHRKYISLLKALGFLSQDGSPTPRYHEYRNRAIARSVMGKALKEKYSDIFVLNMNPTEQDKEKIEGKFKSTHNTSDIIAERMAKTFFALLNLADIKNLPNQKKDTPPQTEQTSYPLSLNINIQIHISPDASSDQIEQIFANMEKYLYKHGQ